jgi:acetyl-CoA synthetase
MLRTLYKEDERYVETYWSTYGNDVYTVGDAAKIDEDGYFWIVGRVDDVINVSGHRMSTMEIESAVVSHDRVAECAVIGAADEDTGQAIVAFVTLEGGGEWPDDMDDEIHTARVGHPDSLDQPAAGLARRPASSAQPRDDAARGAR